MQFERAVKLNAPQQIRNYKMGSLEPIFSLKPAYGCYKLCSYKSIYHETQIVEFHTTVR